MRAVLLRRVALIAGLVAFTLLFGTVGFVLLASYPLSDAFYMTLITITTVGYHEVLPLGRAGRIFNEFLILFGVTVMFISVGAMTQTIIELQLHDRFGRRRTSRMIEKLKGHFIVCGYGRVGRNASRELMRAGAPLVVLDRNEARIEQAREAGLLAMHGDATRDESLQAAGIRRAKGLVSALATDADNLFVILSARTLNPNLTIVTRASEDEAAEKLRRAGADTVLSPFSITGHRLANALLRPLVV
ncbi:MAG: potassium channel family protein, partial [Acidobacteriota bacterium]|nr:potassium channel family protein [Acidobacteriota bacterium]